MRRHFTQKYAAKRILPMFLILILLISGCGNTPSSSNSGDNSSISGNNDMFTDRDFEVGYDDSTSVLIQLNGDSASSSSDSVQISGSTITITEEATYILSGTLNNGMIIVNAKDTAKLQLVFNGVSINSETSAPLYILEADKVFVTLAPDTTNTLSNGGTFTDIDENNIDAAIFSKQDVTFNGPGSLTVTSPAGHGIVSKDDLVITSGSYVVNSDSHGLDANDSVRIANAAITVDSGKDGIHAEHSDDASLGFVYISSGTLNIDADDDGISAGAYMQIEGGTFDIVSADDAVHSNTSITVNGGVFDISSSNDAFHADETLTITAGTINIIESYEGLEALDIIVSGGNITLTARDDGLNAAGGTDSSGFGGMRGNDMFGGRGGGMSSASNGSIVISGGNLYVKASGDGIDANGTLEISGGYTVVCGPTQGDTATLDYDKSGVITGGTFIGTGASGMAQTFSDSKQGTIAVRVGNQTAGTPIILEDKSGNTLISYAPELPFAVIILSSPDIISGETYTITIGGSSGEFPAINTLHSLP